MFSRIIERNRSFLAATGVAAVLGLGFAVSHAEKAEDKHADKAIYVCADREAPCLSDTAEGCVGCGEEVEKKAYTLENHMEMVGLAARLLEDDIRKKRLDKLKERTDILVTVASRVSDFAPPRNTSDLEKYTALAEEMRTSAEALVKAAEGEDKKALRDTYRSLNRTCNGCHQLYRE